MPRAPRDTTTLRRKRESAWRPSAWRPRRVVAVQVAVKQGSQLDEWTRRSSLAGRPRQACRHSFWR